MNLLTVNPYSVITIIMTAFYIYSMFKSSKLISKLNSKIGISLPGSNRAKFKEIKNICVKVRGTELEADANKLLFFMNLNAYTLYIGLGIFVLMMLLGV